MMTTTSGTYTCEEYEKIEKEVEKAFIDFWNGKIDEKEHRKILKNSGLSRGEIESIQYTASIKN